MRPEDNDHAQRIAVAWLACLAGICASARSQEQPAHTAEPVVTATSLEDTRLAMGKWLETEQIIGKERKEWQQGREILVGRLELVKQEIAMLQQKIKQAEASVVEAERQRSELLAEKDRLSATVTQVTEAVARLEDGVRLLVKRLPEPVQTKVQPMHDRMPEPAPKTRVTAAERFQNVLTILGEINKANNELTISYEVRNLADGKPSEVKVMYVGLAQAYYVSARGEAGIGRPSPEGWRWEPSKAIGNDVLMALEIAQGKQTPAFVSLPVKLQ